MLRSVLHLLLFLIMLAPAASSAVDAPGPRIAPGAKVATVKKPTHVTHAGDGSGRLFITEQEGRIVIVKDGVLLSAPFLDIRGRVSCCGERGLLSVAFPPAYREKRYFYVNYTDTAGDTKVARYRVTKDADRADPASEEIVLTVQQPYANHNGGQLAFGPDGNIYIGMGDGGSANDPYGYGQKMNTLLGKLLRIDVESGGRPYAVPLSNPFVGKKDARPEIWASGLRNPWRFSFDRATGDLFIADVGQNSFEEVNVQPSSSKGGENYGWNIVEGFHCFQSKTCDTTRLAMPAAEYGRDEGCSVTGGMVYRGKALPISRGPICTVTTARAGYGGCAGRPGDGPRPSWPIPGSPSRRSARTRQVRCTWRTIRRAGSIGWRDNSRGTLRGI